MHWHRQQISRGAYRLLLDIGPGTCRLDVFSVFVCGCGQLLNCVCMCIVCVAGMSSESAGTAHPVARRTVGSSSAQGGLPEQGESPRRGC